ncbi:MAG: glutamyl-tRNA reductase [Candidatus Rokubacteria bacterium]|nr:glutamyl-tRNA reductase [Candidatus Rokubacteria bacterium]
MAALFVAGLNHRTAPVEVREQIALEPEKLREVLQEVVERGLATEVLILSTCNRVEIYGVAEVPGEARTAAFRALSAHRGISFASLEPMLYTLTEPDEVIRHAFRVAASLDSMVVGEPQILGQVKDAFALAQSCQTLGPVLHALMTQTFGVAKRVRTDTGIGHLAVSASFAAVELARKIFGSLDGKAVLLVGAGEMGELAARHLADHGTLPIRVLNRTAARAETLARALAGIAVPFAALGEALAEVDIAIASTAAPAPIITVELVRAALPARRGRPLFLIDLAVPRDVEAAVNALDNVFCYDIDDLRSVVEANLRERHHHAKLAEAMVDREVAKFGARLRDLEVVPTIVSLREKLESIRRGEVAKALARLPEASADTRVVIEALSQAIVNKVLHAPIVKLRDSSRDGHGRRWTQLIAEVFGLGAGSRTAEPEGSVPERKE